VLECENFVGGNHIFIGANSDRVVGFARKTITTILLVGLLAAIFPLETLAIGSTCTLACCAGRAPHVAGSCMNGSCHAAIKRSTHHSQLKRKVREQFCGFASFALRHQIRRDSVSRPASQSPNASNQTRFSSATFTKPCLEACGSCGAASTASDKGKHALTTSRRRAPVPVTKERARAHSRIIETPLAVLQKGPPRGPPTTSF
jgi:hypothetical protein